MMEARAKEKYHTRKKERKKEKKRKGFFFFLSVMYIFKKAIEEKKNWRGGMCCTHRMMMGGSSGSRLSYKLLRTAQKRKKRTFVRSFLSILIIVSMQRGPWRARKEKKKKYDNL